MPSLTGLATIDYSGVTTAGQGIDLLLAVIPNPDTTSTSGAITSSVQSQFDEMMPHVASAIRAELTALKAKVGAWDAS